MTSRVLIVGGGAGGLEAALALSATADREVHVDLLSPDPLFSYRPWSVTTPFGHGAAVEVDLREVATDRGFGFVEARLLAVDAHLQRVSTDRGEFDYDSLVLALGARPVPVVDGAFTFRGPPDAVGLRDLLAEDRLPDDGRVVFVANASAAWSLPAYELALQTAWRARRSGRRLRVALTTAEATPLEDFGSEASAAVAALLAERGIEVFAETLPDAFDGSSLYVPMAGAIPADVVVALPALVGRHVPGLPHDGGGFVEVDDLCRVRGVEAVFAVGDMTARPLKQGGLATQQADVAANVIAAAAGVPIAPEPYAPILRAMLLTGDEPLYLLSPPRGEARSHGGVAAPWWPAHKIVGAHLGTYLATHAELLVTP